VPGPPAAAAGSSTGSTRDHSQLLRGHALKLVIDDIDRVDFRAAEHVIALRAMGGGVVIGGLLAKPIDSPAIRSVAFAEEIAALAANQLQLDGSLGDAP